MFIKLFCKLGLHKWKIIEERIFDANGSLSSYSKTQECLTCGRKEYLPIPFNISTIHMRSN